MINARMPGGTAATQSSVAPEACGAGGTAPSRSDLQAGGTAATPSRFLDPPRPLWQWDCWDTQLRDANQYGEKWQYVTMNPVRKGLVAGADDWAFRGTLHELRW